MGSKIYQVEMEEANPAALEQNSETVGAVECLPMGWAITERIQRRLSTRLKELLDALL